MTNRTIHPGALTADDVDDLITELWASDLEDFFRADNEGEVIEGFQLVESDSDVAIVGKGNRFFQIEREEEHSYGESWWSQPNRIFEVEPYKEIIIRRGWKKKKGEPK